MFIANNADELALGKYPTSISDFIYGLAAKSFEAKRGKIIDGAWGETLRDAGVRYAEWAGGESPKFSILPSVSEASILSLVNPAKSRSYSLISVFSPELDSGHWILITGVDPKRKIMTYVDPNYPNVKRFLQYRDNPHGGLEIISSNLNYIRKKPSANPLRTQQCLFVDLSPQDGKPLQGTPPTPERRPIREISNLQTNSQPLQEGTIAGTERLEIGAARVRDFDASRIVPDREVRSMIGELNPDKDVIKHLLGTSEAPRDKNDLSKFMPMLFAIRSKEGGRPIGFVSIAHARTPRNSFGKRYLEIGSYFAQGPSRQEFSEEAIRETVKYLRSQYKLDLLYTRVSTANTNATATLEKIGFKPEPISAEDAQYREFQLKFP